MIDLSKPQVLTEPVKCWVRNCENNFWEMRWLIGITEFTGSLIFVVGTTYDHRRLPIRFYLGGSDYFYFHYCTLTDPNAPTKRLMTHVEIFNAFRLGALVRSKNTPRNIYGYWNTDININAYEICYNYTGNDSDVWEAPEVTV